MPERFIQREDLNYFYKKASTFFPFENGEKLCDGDLNNAVFVKKNGENANLKITFPKGQYLHSISSKIQTESDVVVVAGLKNGQKKKLGSYKLSENYQLQILDIQEVVRSLTFVSKSGFSVFEIAALADLPKESIVFDFLEKKQLGKVILKNWSGGQAIHSTKISVSNDQKNWEEIRTFRGEFAFPYAINFPKEKEAQYLKVECELTDKDWQKASIFELKIYDENGEFGARPIAQKSPATLKEMLGVNGYWSWGTNTFRRYSKREKGHNCINYFLLTHAIITTSLGT